ncbi:MAG: hypothetical protein FJ034_08675 [Chloroflexi bacterium]|nr:hypothetical protein [Chloroflexota bacterium]
MREFELGRPIVLRDALRMVAEGAGVPLGGGTDLFGMMKADLEAPQRLVDLTLVPELSGWERERGALRLGGALPLGELERSELATELPILREALSDLATEQLRNAGTVAGNLLQQNRCWYFRDHAVPCWHKGGQECFAIRGDSRFHAIVGVQTCMMVAPSDLAPALIAYDAVVELRSTFGVRKIPLQHLYQVPGGPQRSELAIYPGEVLVAVRIPGGGRGRRGAFVKSLRRKAWSFALASVAASAKGRGKVLRDVRIVAGGVAAMPWRVPAAEAVLEGRSPDDAACDEAARILLEDAKTKKDNAYKVPLTRELVRRALQGLVTR